MPFLQRASSRHGVEVPKPLRINKPATPVSSSSSSPSPQQPRSRSKPVSYLHNLEYPEPLRIRRPTKITTPLPSLAPRPHPQKLTRPLPTNEPSVSTPLPPASAPSQHRRLEISPLPRQPRLTPPSKAKPVDSAHRNSASKTPRTPNLFIKRRTTYHTTNEPATPTLPPGNHVSVTTGSTPSPTSPPTSKSSRFLSAPPSPFRDEKNPPFRSNFDTGIDAILPAPLNQTLANHNDILSIPPSPSPPPKKRRTEIKRKLRVTQKTISALLFWNSDPRLDMDLEVIDEKLKMTAQAVVKSGEKWRRCATFLPTRSDFDGFQGTMRAALNGALEIHGYPGRRIGESEEVVEVEVEVRDTAVERVSKIRGLTLEHLRSRGRLDRTP